MALFLINSRKGRNVATLKTIIFLSVFLLVFCPPVLGLDTTVFVNGKHVILEQAPVIEDGRTLLPFRDLFEAMGLTIEWDETTRTVIGKNDSILISFVIGKPSALVNGVEKSLDVPAQIINGRTLVPARFVAEATGLEVNWDAANRRVLIGTGEIVGDIEVLDGLKANVQFLYTTEGQGEFAGHRRLHGYPAEEEFGVYVQGTHESYVVRTVDLRGLNRQEKFTWTYEGKNYVNTRGEIYNFFSNSSYFISRVDSDSALSQN